MNRPTEQEDPNIGREAADAEPLWNLIPLNDFKAPTGAAPEVVRSGLHDLWQRLRGGNPHMDGDNSEAAVEMERPSQRLLDWAAPRPDWATEETAGLLHRLQAWLERDNGAAGVQTLIDSPISLLSDRLTRWSIQQDYLILDPPSPEQILSADLAWVDELPLSRDNRLLLPSLERCFLRDHNGLVLLRRLLDRIGKLEPALLVICNSWAWRYLCQIEQIDDVLGAPLAPAPFGEHLLNRWLSRSAHKASPFELVFREATSGKAVLDTIDLERTVESNASTFLKNLASRSRGNPRVAWEVWRRSLLTAKDSTVGKDAQDAAKKDEGYTLWVRPWDQVQLPDLTGGATHLDGMILCAILQHGGLPQSLLTDLLPVVPSQIISTLQQLRSGGFVLHEKGYWKPAPAGYPAVRRFLTNEGFLVDQL